jgi:hypothetical protein
LGTSDFYYREVIHKLLGALRALGIFGTESEHSYVIEGKGSILVL